MVDTHQCWLLRTHSGEVGTTMGPVLCMIYTGIKKYNI